MEILNALEHHQAGRLAEAVQIYRQILQNDPDNADALHLMGNAAGQLGDVDYSISLISRASALAPGNTAYLLSLGTAYRIKQQFEPAMACYFRILDIEPRHAPAYSGIGNALQKLGRTEEAIQSYATAIELNPQSPDTYYALANLEKSLGHHKKAIAHYESAVALQSDFADAYHNMGSAWHALGHPDAALNSYRQALWANLPETHNNIGAILFEREQYADALVSYRLAIAAQPDYAEAFNNMGNAQRKLAAFDQAVAAFCEAIRLRPDYAVAYLNLGDLLMDRERIGEAAQQYQNAIAAAPAMAQAWFHLGVARTRLNEVKSALGCFEQALVHRPGYPDALYNLGLVSARLGRPAEAEHSYRQLLNLQPNYIDAHINLSAILLEDGRTAEAKKHIDFAYSRKNLFERRSPHADKTVLILFDAGKGNLNLTHLFDEKANNILDWMIEYAPDDQCAQLPRHDLVFNAMGDADLTGDIGRPLKRFLRICDKPLLNHPDKVAPTARHMLPGLLENIPNLLMPAVWRFADHTDWHANIATRLPLLVRPVHTQGGEGMELAASVDELAQIRSRQSSPVYVARYIDYRSADGWFRKYRVIFIDREPYPYHMAISEHWMVHYHTADMETSPWKLEEEKSFLQDPEAVLGAAGMQAIRAIGATMDLDYAGIDFSLLPDGRILVFEANPSMLVHPENALGVLEHKNVHIHRIYLAFEALLKRTARLS